MTTSRIEGSLTLVDMGATYTNGRGDLAIGRNATVAGTLAITGASTLTGALTVSSTTTSTTSATGAIICAGGAGIAGTATIGGLLSAQGKIIQGTTIGAGTATDTLTAAECVNGVYTANGASFTGTTATAAAIVALLPNAVAATTIFFLFVRNTHGSGTFTLGAGSGVTISGTATVAAGQAKTFLAIVDNITSSSEAVTFYSMGTATL